jgi:anti-sigma factor RsiW
MRRQTDDHELERLERELGALFEATRTEVTPERLERLRRHAAQAAEPPPRPSPWAWLRVAAAGAALAAAAVAAVLFFQAPEQRRLTVASVSDASTADASSVQATASPDAVREVDSAVSAAWEWAFGEADAPVELFFEDEWYAATSFDLLYGPMPGDDEGDWQQLYEHLLTEEEVWETEF